MEERINNRLALLGGLLAIGLTLAGLGSALGAGTIFQGNPNMFGAEMNGNQVTIYEGGKMIQNFTLPEDGEYTWNTSNGGVYISGGGIGKGNGTLIRGSQAEHEAELNESINIAKNDSRVKELIAGKDYEIILAGAIGKSGITGVGGEGRAGTEIKMDTAVLTIKVEDKYYKITVDMSSETVKSIEEQASPIMTVCYGEGCSK